jgi:pimeloyl-ACP methyl ester carboxylesterase
LNELHHLLWLQTDRFASLPAFIERDLLLKNHEHAWILRRAMRSMLTGRDLMDGRVQRVAMPVLLLWGMNDRIVPLPIGQRMRSELPDARLVAYSGCGHLAVIECRDRLLPEVERFLAAR